LSINRIEVERLYKEGYDATKIATKLNSKASTIRQCISRNFKHLKEVHDENYNKINNTKEIIKDYYEKGFMSNEIAAKLKNNSIQIDAATIRQCISRNFKHLKEVHEQNYNKRKEIRKETNKILNKENNNIMSKRTVVEQNIQSYDQQKDGRYVFNQKRAGLIPWDIPKVYVFQA